MKKRVFSILLCLCMVMTLLPTAALADSNTYGKFTVTGDDLSGVSYSGKVLTVASNAAVTISQTGGVTTDRIVVDSSSGASITLAGVNIDVSGTDDAAAFKITSTAGAVNLTLADGSENILKSGSNNAGVAHIATNAATMLTIGGSGSLTATGGNGTSGTSGTSKNSYGIIAAALTIGSSAKVTAVGSKADGEWAKSVGLYANSKLVITGTAQVTATGGEAKYSYGVQTTSSGGGYGIRYVSGKLTASGGTQASENPVYQGLTGNTEAPATTGAYTDKCATWEPPEAQWGAAGANNAAPTTWVGRGSLTDAVEYANTLTSGTAYIKLSSDVNTTGTLLFSSTTTTILDLNGKTIDAKGGNFSVLTVYGNLTLCDSSTADVAKQGKITGGKRYGDFGGGVYIDSVGTFTMTGGNITGNTSEKSGGGVFGTGALNDHVVMTMTGGRITGNHTQYNGGGVFIQTGIFTVGGTAKITDNTSGTAPDILTNNVYLLGSSFPPSQQILTISAETPLVTGASIGVRTTYVPNASSPLDFTDTNSADYSDYFTSDNSSYVVQNSGSGSAQVVQLAVPPIQAPTVTAVSPTSGSTAGGTSVTITGTNLSDATAVNFGSASATITATSATSITATAPAGTGTVDITVTTPGGTSATSEADKFTYTLPTAAEYTAASPAAPGTDYVVDDSANTLTIKTAKGAAWWSAHGDSYLDYAVMLDDDINVSGFLWTPVGNQLNKFTGTFDGQNHKLSGLTVVALNGSYAGLFGQVGNTSSVKNLTVSGSINVSDSSACYAGGIVGHNSGVIDHCSSSAAVTLHTKNSYPQSCVGGIAGSNYEGIIKNCSNSGAITATSEYVTNAGGILGDFGGGSVINCYNTGTVSASGGASKNYAGGIAGDAYNQAVLTNCYNTGEFSTSGGTYAKAGSISGRISSDVRIIHCYFKTAATKIGIYDLSSYPATGCGTFEDSFGTLTKGTETNCGTEQQTPAPGTALLDALNGWVTTAYRADYYTWVADNATTPANSGYPVFGPAYVPPEAQWGVANGGGAPSSWADSGTLVDAVTYANALTDGTAYIQLLSNVDNSPTHEFAWRKTTILDLNGKTITAKAVVESEDDHNVLFICGILTLCDTSSAIIAEQGTITGGHGTGEGMGGGVYVSDSGNFTMTGGNITGNTAINGGGVGNMGEFTMTGGSIAGNTAINGGMGGGVVNQGIFTMSGGSITGNTVANGGVGGGVANIGAVQLSGNVQISGDVNISGNTVGTADSNLVLLTVGEPSTIQLTAALTNTVPIGVSIVELTQNAGSFVFTPKAGVFTSGTAVVNSDYLSKFVSDNRDYAVIAEGSQLKLAAAQTITQPAATNGSFTVKVDDNVVTSAVQGAIVTVTPTADDGYELDTITVTKTGEPGTTVTVTDGSFTMPSYPVTVTVSFKPIPAPSTGGAPSVTIPASSNEGSVNVSTTISGGTANISVTDTQLSKIASVGNADVGTVKVDVSSIKADAAVIPAKLVTAAANATGSEGLEVAFSTGSVALDKTALESVGNKSITVSVEEVETAELTTAQKETLGSKTDTALVVDINVLVNGVKTPNFGGGIITVSIPYTAKDGEDTSKLVVWYLADDGTLEPMNGKYNAEAECYEFTTTHLSTYVLTSFPFTDVAADSYYYNAAAWAAANGITAGTRETTFSPGNACTRAQAVTFLWRAMGCPEPTTASCQFADVKADAYYYKAVLWATEKGITEGTSDTAFSPEDTVTRGQVVTLQWRTAGKPAATAVNPFKDVASGAYCRDAVVWAVAQKITEGTSATAFSPADPCTRAQIVTFLYRYLAK